MINIIKINNNFFKILFMSKISMQVTKTWNFIFDGLNSCCFLSLQADALLLHYFNLFHSSYLMEFENTMFDCIRIEIAWMRRN